MKLVPRSSIDGLTIDCSPQLSRRFQRRLDNRRIAGAPAQMPRQHIADLGFVRLRTAGEQRIKRHQNAGSAEPALQCMIPLEGGLQDAESTLPVGEALHGPNLAPFDLECEGETGARGPAIDDHGAGATNAVLATDMGAGRPDLVTNEVAQKHPRLADPLDHVAVEHKANLVALLADMRVIESPPQSARDRSSARGRGGNAR